MLNTPEDRHTTSNLAYADDLAAMTASFADVKVQAQKVQAFVAWSGMTVICKKCAITGMLYGQAQRDGSSNVLSESMINMMKDRVRQITTLKFLSITHTQTLTNDSSKQHVQPGSEMLLKYRCADLALLSSLHLQLHLCVISKKLLQFMLQCDHLLSKQSFLHYSPYNISGTASWKKEAPPSTLPHDDMTC